MTRSFIAGTSESEMIATLKVRSSNAFDPILRKTKRHALVVSHLPQLFKRGRRVMYVVVHVCTFI